MGSRQRSQHLSRAFVVERLEQRRLLALTVSIDYSLDTSNFFSAGTKQLLQATLDTITSNFSNSLAPVPSTTYSLDYGDTGTVRDVTTSVPTDTLKIYAYGAPLSGGTVGEGGAFYSVPGPYRGQADNVFAPQISFLMFNNSRSTNWYFGASTAGETSGQVDFVSVARHEILHALGLIETSVFNHFHVGDQFVGPHASAGNNGQPVPLQHNDVHIANSLLSVFNPATLDGTRLDLTSVEYGMLQDIGWTIPNPPPPPPSTHATTLADYDGNHTTDLAVYLPTPSIFAYRPSSGADVVQQFGSPGQSIPVVGDYNGDGKADLAVYLPGPSIFAYRPSGGGPDVVQQFGSPGQSIPVVGDFDGSGRTELGIYLPGPSIFAYRPANGGPDVVQQFGSPGQSVPVVGDFDGGGKTNLAVYLPGPSIFAYRPSSGGPDVVQQFGSPGQSVPVAADFDGDGKTDLAVYLPVPSIFAYRPSHGGADVVQQFGPPGVSTPVVGDYDGDGKADLAIYLPGPSIFAYRPSHGGADVVQQFGPPAISKPVATSPRGSLASTVAPAFSKAIPAVAKADPAAISVLPGGPRKVAKPPNQAVAIRIV